MRDLWGRVRARPREALFAAAVGLFCSWAVLQSFVFNDPADLGPFGLLAVVLGGMLLPVIASPLALPQKLGKASADFWDAPGSSAVVRGSVYGCVAIAWGLVVVLLLRTP